MRRRGRNSYDKPSLSEAELLERWRERGLVVFDQDRATRYLRHIGYYRLSAYVRSFESSRDSFRTGTSFDDVLGLYIFDRKLRLLMLDALERVEVAIRAALSDHLSRQWGPHWYEDAGHFRRENTHRRLLGQVDRLVDEQLERPAERADGGDSFVSALEHYVTHYGSPRRPPSWLVFEDLSLGSIRAAYSSLARGSDQAAIARSLGLQAPVLHSWLLTYQRVRNVSAHHGRLWNRGLGVYPMIPKSHKIRWLEDAEIFARDPWRRQRLFPVVVSLQTILHTISPGSQWAFRVHELLEEHPDVPRGSMGFPADWLDDPFWPRRHA